MMMVLVGASPASAHAGGRVAGKQMLLQHDLLYIRLLTDNSEESTVCEIVSLMIWPARRNGGHMLSRAKVAGAVVVQLNGWGSNDVDTGSEVVAAHLRYCGAVGLTDM